METSYKGVALAVVTQGKGTCDCRWQMLRPDGRLELIRLKGAIGVSEDDVSTFGRSVV